MKKHAGMLALLCAHSFCAAQSTSFRGSCPPPTISDTSVCGAGVHSIEVQGNQALFRWWNEPLGGGVINLGSSFNATITSDTTFYVDAQCNDSTFLLPPHQSSFPSFTRGYWFTAPIDFVITGILVPTDGSSDSVSTEIVRFNSAPQGWPNTSNDFTSLVYHQSIAGTTVIATNIQILQGDIIGVLGSRGGVNSYTATGPVSVDIGGFSTTLTRMGFQDELASSQAHDLWTEASQPIGRIQLFVGAPANSSIRLPINVQLLENSSSSQDEFFCFGDSLLVNGDYYYADTTLAYQYTNAVGCDSIHQVNIDAGQELLTSVVLTANNDAMVINFPVGNVNYYWVDCNDNMAHVPGEVSTFFYPQVNGVYALKIVGPGGCEAFSPCIPMLSVGTAEDEHSEFAIYPNPVNDDVFIDLGALHSEVRISIHDVLGRTVVESLDLAPTRKVKLALPGPSGIYFIHIEADGKSLSHRVFKG